ncbi:MAG: hypothetical protein QM758_13770 [Armatimonas sp.]
MSATDLERLETPAIIILSMSDQVFQFTDEEGTEWHWNASQGMRIALASGKGPMAFYPSDCGLDEAQVRSQYPELDETYALTTDLSKPVLFVPFTNGTSILIDGWHRLFNAIRRGVPYLLSYELTPEERDSNW